MPQCLQRFHCFIIVLKIKFTCFYVDSLMSWGALKGTKQLHVHVAETVLGLKIWFGTFKTRFIANNSCAVDSVKAVLQFLLVYLFCFQ